MEGKKHMNDNNNKPKLELQVNVPTKVKLLQDNAATGESQYGKWFLYNVLSDGQEQSFFAPEQIVKFISENNLKRHSELEITKKLVKNGSKNTADFLIEIVSNGKSQDTSTNTNDTNNQKRTDYDNMVEALKEALKIRESLNSDVIVVNKIGITLFIQKCKGMHQNY